MSNLVVKTNNDIEINEQLLEKVILQNDLAGMTSIEKVQHVKNVCLSLNLNPLTKPIQLHKFQGKEVMYMSKDGAEQLRKNHNVSISSLETDILRGDLYVVKAHAQLPNGRQDCSTAVVSIAGLKGDAIGNAMKKCETQSKRRVTLSICGLGMLSEEELENLPKETFSPPKQAAKTVDNANIVNDGLIELDIDGILIDISQCESKEELRKLITSLVSLKGSLSKEASSRIIEAKNRKQEELSNKQKEEDRKKFTDEYDGIDQETGEIV